MVGLNYLDSSCSPARCHADGGRRHRSPGPVFIRTPLTHAQDGRLARQTDPLPGRHAWCDRHPGR